MSNNFQISFKSESRRPFSLSFRTENSLKIANTTIYECSKNYSKETIWSHYLVCWVNALILRIKHQFQLADESNAMCVVKRSIALVHFNFWMSTTLSKIAYVSSETISFGCCSYCGHFDQKKGVKQHECVQSMRSKAMRVRIKITSMWFFSEILHESFVTYVNATIVCAVNKSDIYFEICCSWIFHVAL